MTSNLSNYFKLTRPNASIQWAHEYILTSKDQELKPVLNQYILLKKFTDGGNGWTTDYFSTDDDCVMWLRCTYDNSTFDSISHQAVLYTKRIKPYIRKWEQWSINYNKMYGIRKVLIDM